MPEFIGGELVVCDDDNKRLISSTENSRAQSGEGSSSLAAPVHDCNTIALLNADEQEIESTVSIVVSGVS